MVGPLVLWAMWVAHLVLFRGGGRMEWVGLVIVVQNIVGSLFNSFLFDFTGVDLRARRRRRRHGLYSL